MKLALITPGFSAGDHDWCIPALLELVRALGVRHEVHIFALRYPYRAGRYRAGGATVHALGGGARAGLARGPLLAQALAQLLAEARRGPFDALHGIWADEPGFLAMLAGQLLRVPTVVSLFGGELVAMDDIGYGHGLSRANRWFVAQALAGARWVTAGSALLAERAGAQVAGPRLRQVPLGVEPTRFQPSGVPRALTLLHVGSLLAVKDQAMLLRAFARVVRAVPDARLWLAGDGPLRAALQQQGEALGVSAGLRFLGALPHDALPALYAQATLCLLTSRVESQGMVVLEAAACGVPTLGTAVGILPELMGHANVVPVGDDSALAALILARLRAPAWLASERQRLPALIRAHHTVAHSAAAFETLYGAAGA